MYTWDKGSHAKIYYFVLLAGSEMLHLMTVLWWLLNQGEKHNVAVWHPVVCYKLYL